MRRVAACCLGALLWLLTTTTPLAQDLRTSTGPQAVAAPPPIALSIERPVLNLEGRSRAWVDPSGFRTIEQVLAAGETLPWTLHRRGRSYDLEEKALWLQFDAISSGTHRWMLQIASSAVGRAQLFYRAADGRLVQEEAGHAEAVSNWPVPGRYPTFELAPGSGTPVRYWLRVEQDRIGFAGPMRLYESSTLIGSREDAQFLFGAYFGLAGLIALGALANALAFRDRNFALFGLYVAALAAGQLAALGLGEQHLWDGWMRWNDTATFLLPGIASAAGLWFARGVTEPARFSRALDLAVWSVIAALLSAAALDTVLSSSNSFLLVTVISLVGVLVAGGLLLLAWRHGEDPHIGIIAAGFTPILLMNVVVALTGLGMFAPSSLTREGLPVGAAIGLPILFYALSLRTSHRREANVRAAALARNDALTGLAHQRTLLQRLDGAIARARGLKHVCALMMLKISNFEAVATEFGRETADRMLVVTASLLRRAASDIDMEARVGDHHFALLLEGPTTAETVINRAQELVARGLRPTSALPPGITVKFHVAVALLPHEQLDGAATLGWLLAAVNSMPPDTRKLIQAVNF